MVGTMRGTNARTWSVVLALAVAAVGCAHITPRGSPPAASWTARRALDDAATCVVAALNEEMRSQSALSPSITHQVQTIEPGRVYEVVPQQTLTVAAEIYFVRLAAMPPSATRIELFSVATWTSRLERAVAKCA